MDPKQRERAEGDVTIRPTTSGRFIMETADGAPAHGNKTRMFSVFHLRMERKGIERECR